MTANLIRERRMDVRRIPGERVLFTSRGVGPAALRECARWARSNGFSASQVVVDFSDEDSQDMRREARQERRVAEKTYLKCSAKARTFDNGGSVIKVGIKVDDLIAFAREHGNQGGYLNLVVSERREPGKYGDTHTVYLDDYVPRPRD